VTPLRPRVDDPEVSAGRVARRLWYDACVQHQLSGGKKVDDPEVRGLRVSHAAIGPCPAPSMPLLWLAELLSCETTSRQRSECCVVDLFYHAGQMYPEGSPEARDYVRFEPDESAEVRVAILRALQTRTTQSEENLDAGGSIMDRTRGRTPCA
jgi:hypothetical protein